MSMHAHTRADVVPLPILLWSTGVWWILAMDGRRMRLLVREGRNGAFHEAIQPLAEEDERPVAAIGSGPRHARFETLERAFVERVARRLERFAQRDAFDHLAVFAAPAALGVLRGALGAGALRRLRFSEAVEIVDEPLGRILERIGLQA
ncbi:MAG: host attachment protein [Caulobacteraceae bacterium]|nr:host attachment protein [Caulobacteraceae bacterium]